MTRLDCWVSRFEPEVGQIGPKWDKSGELFRSDSVLDSNGTNPVSFSDQIQYILAQCAKMY